MIPRLLALFALLSGLAALAAPANATPLPQPSCQSTVSVGAIVGKEQRADQRAWTRERAFAPARFEKADCALDRGAPERSGVRLQADRALE